MKRAHGFVLITVFVWGFLSLESCNGKPEKDTYTQDAVPLRTGRQISQEDIEIENNISKDTVTTELQLQPTATAYTSESSSNSIMATTVAAAVESTPSSVMAAVAVSTMTPMLTPVTPGGGNSKLGSSFTDIGVGLTVTIAVSLVFVIVLIVIAVIVAIFALMRMRVRKIRKRLLTAVPNVPTAMRRNVTNEALPGPDVEKGVRSLSARRTLMASFHPRSLDREVEFSTLQLQEKLGTGAYGSVYKAIATNDPDVLKPAVVAVKVLKEGAQQTERQALLTEINLMKQLDPTHPHLVRMLGCCTTGEDVALVMEFMPHGNLRDFLVKHRELTEDRCLTDPPVKVELGQTVKNGMQTSKIKQMSTYKLLSLARQIVTGMEYLSSKKILHCNLAAKNVLIDREGKLRISNFGLSRDLYEALYYQPGGRKLPLRWMAIEAIVDRSFTVQSDVWSFGIVLWEIFTLGAFPYPEFSNSEILEKLREGYRMPQPRNCPNELYQLMCDCWKEQPSERPSFERILERLDRIIAQDEEARQYLDMTQLDSEQSSRRGSAEKSSNCGVEETEGCHKIICVKK